MDFEEIVCYSQTLIVILVVIGYIVSKTKNSTKITKTELRCLTCNSVISDKNRNYCTSCGALQSHSEGLSLEQEKKVTNITNINISDSVISKSLVGNREDKNSDEKS